jgi:HSP20 family protein
MSEATLSKSEYQTLSKDRRPSENFRRPWYRIESGKEEHTLYVALPGVAKLDVNVALDGDQLTITGRRTSHTPDTWKTVFSELGQYDYRLALRLNVRVDESKISGEVVDGMLKLVLPMSDEAKPRMIKVD